MPSKLKPLLQSWDKKDTDFLKSVFDRYSKDKDFLEQLIIYLSDSETESASSWLIKNYFHKTKEIEYFSDQIYQNLQNFKNWDAQLHILQIMDSLTISFALKEAVEETLRKLLISENKFVRAWSYNGFYIFATKFPEYREEVDLFLKLALEDEPASIKARIRNIIKSKKW